MADKEQRDVMMTSSCIDSCSADRIKQPPFYFIYFLGKMKLKSAPPSGWKVKIMGQRFNAFGCRYFRQVLTSVESDCVPRRPWNTENIGHGWWNGWWNERLEQQGRRLLVFWNRVAAAVAIGLESGSAIRNAAHWKLFQAVVHDGHFFSLFHRPFQNDFQNFYCADGDVSHTRIIRPPARYWTTMKTSGTNGQKSDNIMEHDPGNHGTVQSNRLQLDSNLNSFISTFWNVVKFNLNNSTE